MIVRANIQTQVVVRRPRDAAQSDGFCRRQIHENVNKSDIRVARNQIFAQPHPASY